MGSTLSALQNSTSAIDLPAQACRYKLSGVLQPGQKYYWRIDSENGTGNPTHGPTWVFRTQDAPIPNDITFFVASDTHYGRANNATFNRSIIDEMNSLPGEPLPESIGGGYVRTPRGLVMNGDLLDEGANQLTAPALWKEFCADYGLNGQDGRLDFPVYEGFGNHDGPPLTSISRAGIRERNKKRVGLTAVSENGLHYSWDWDQLHLVQLNLFGGHGPEDIKGVSPVDHNPEASLDFLQQDLAKHACSNKKWVIVFQHFSWLGGMSDWWTSAAKERFYQVVEPYQIACLINGHSHGIDFLPWHDLITIHDGATATDPRPGNFLVVHVTPQRLTIIERKMNASNQYVWGQEYQRGLRAKDTDPQPPKTEPLTIQPESIPTEGTETVVIFRHGEKPSPALGMLSEKGFQRALALPDILVTKFGQPTHLFAPNPSINKFREGYNGEECCYVRALLTIAPTAVKVKLPIDTDFGLANIRGLQAEIEKPAYHQSNVFVCWEHVGAEHLARNLIVASGGSGTNVPTWPTRSPDEYDTLYVVKIHWNPDGTRSATFAVDRENVVFSQ